MLKRALDIAVSAAGLLVLSWALFWNSDEGAILAGSVDPERTYLEEIRLEKVRLQLEYVRKRSFATDLRIIGQTAAVTMLRKSAPAVRTKARSR